MKGLVVRAIRRRSSVFGSRAMLRSFSTAEVGKETENKSEGEDKHRTSKAKKVVTDAEMMEYLQDTHGVAAQRDVDMEGHSAVEGAAIMKDKGAEFVTGVEIDELMQQTMKLPQSWGVFRENERDDLEVMANAFTVPALAKALRDRETTLQVCAQLMSDGKVIEMKDLLRPYRKEAVMKRRNKRRPLDLSTSFSRNDLVILQRFLHRMPRQVFQAREKRASVVMPLCNDNGVASVLFEKRPMTMRKHKGEVCFPGGMVDEDADSTIIQTSLRETSEELGIPGDAIDVLGILRCNWDEVEHMTGVAVTPVMGWLGELNDLNMNPNPDEVEQYFTVPMRKLLDEKHWTIKEKAAPVFTGGPFVIWGLTAYLLRRFLLDVVRRTHLIEGEGLAPRVDCSGEGA